VPLLEVYNKCDLLSFDDRQRLKERHPDAHCISAVDGSGLDDLTAAVTSRLGLDMKRFSLTLDPAVASDRERIARIYRHARVITHETRNGRVSIVGDVPRRLLTRIDPSAG
jgi:50S ribosomal subunit-associated GTPase HflX